MQIVRIWVILGSKGHEGLVGDGTKLIYECSYIEYHDKSLTLSIHIWAKLFVFAISEDWTGLEGTGRDSSGRDKTTQNKIFK